MLRAQLNRFADPGAGALLLFMTPTPATGTPDSDVATRVAAVLTSYLSSPLFSISTTAAQTALGKLLGGVVFDEVGTAAAPPGTFTAANIAQLNSLIAGYADVSGLPAPSLLGTLAGLDQTTVLLLGAAALGAYLYFAKRKKR